jgi:hypothetical protein
MPADNSQTHEQLLQLLNEVLVSFKPQFAEGISEFELINLLKEAPYQLFNADALSDSLVLFQTHFILFHALYKLRAHWRAELQGELDICATQIRLLPNVERPIPEDATNLQEAEPLAEYYLNWQNLSDTKHADVEDLLSQFWLKMAGFDDQFSMSDQEVADACYTLEIGNRESLDLRLLKQQYRKLQHRYHPDKGGDVAQSQAVLHAYTALHKLLISR